jgi:hypothetical protein
MTKTIIIAIAILIQGTRPAPAQNLGMWIWTQSAFQTKEDRQTLFAFCKTEGISHLDQSIKIQTIKGFRTIANHVSLTEFISRARSQGITLNALRGDPKMFYQRNHDATLGNLRTMIAFNNQLPANSRLTGIKYDVEPYLTEEWKAGGTQREKVIRDYILCLQKIKAIIDKEAPGLLLATDVPFWWDKPEFTVTFAGKTKPLVEHIQDITDYIGIMSYRTSAKEVLNLVSHELSYATKIGKSICPGLETIDLKEKKSHVSFFGTPPSLFRQTISSLQENLAGNKAHRCIMLHHYGSLPSYLSSTSQ